MAAADFCPCARLAVCAEPAGLHANLWFSFAVQFAVYRNGRPAFTLCAWFQPGLKAGPIWPREIRPDGGWKNAGRGRTNTDCDHDPSPAVTSRSTFPVPLIGL